MTTSNGKLVPAIFDSIERACEYLGFGHEIPLSMTAVIESCEGDEASTKKRFNARDARLYYDELSAPVGQMMLQVPDEGDKPFTFIDRNDDRPWYQGTMLFQRYEDGKRLCVKFQRGS